MNPEFELERNEIFIQNKLYMRAVVQRCRKADLWVGGEIHSSIGNGLLVLLGIGNDDDDNDIEWLSGKISRLRIFNDPDDKMNLSVQDIIGEIMVVSQFTLLASTKKGNRPSYIDSAPPEMAIPLYDKFVNRISMDSGLKTVTGVFGAYMSIDFINEGPVTIIIDSKIKE